MTPLARHPSQLLDDWRLALALRLVLLRRAPEPFDRGRGAARSLIRTSKSSGQAFHESVLEPAAGRAGCRRVCVRRVAPARADVMVQIDKSAQRMRSSSITASRSTARTTSRSSAARPRMAAAAASVECGDVVRAGPAQRGAQHHDPHLELSGCGGSVYTR